MGCGSTKGSTDAVDPPYGPKSTNAVTNGVKGKHANAGSKKVIKNSVDDAVELLPGSVPDTEQSESMPPPVSFDIPIDESLIKKHPPKRLQKLEEQQLQVSHNVLQEKQMNAEERRQKVLQERIQSSRRSANPANRSRVAPPRDLGIPNEIEHEKSFGNNQAESSLDF